MTDLSPEAKELLRQARDAFSPPEGRLAAVHAALKAQLAAASSGPLASGPASGIAPRALGTAGWSAGQTLGAAMLIGVIGAGGVAAWKSRSNARSPVPIEVPALVGAMPAAPQPEDALRSDAPTMAVSTPASPSAPDLSTSKSAAISHDRARASSRPRAKSENGREIAADLGDSLAEEVSMLRGARAALDRGDAVQALRLLDTHEAHFQRATLYEERLATRVLALCALGRIDAARSSAHELERAAPHSPHLNRVRASCIAQPSSK